MKKETSELNILHRRTVRLSFSLLLRLHPSDVDVDRLCLNDVSASHLGGDVRVRQGGQGGVSLGQQVVLLFDSAVALHTVQLFHQVSPVRQFHE